MDARVDPLGALGLRAGDAHVIRNAGAVVTDAEIRALAVSQRVLGTSDMLVLVHTDCGMREVDEDALRGELEAETGVRPEWAAVPLRSPRRTPGPRSSASARARSWLEPARCAARLRSTAAAWTSSPVALRRVPRARTHRSDH